LLFELVKVDKSEEEADRVASVLLVELELTLLLEALEKCFQILLGEAESGFELAFNGGFHHVYVFVMASRIFESIFFGFIKNVAVCFEKFNLS